MAITGTGYNGLTAYSLEDGVLTLVGPGGAAHVHVGDTLQYGAEVIEFDALAACATVDFPMFGQIERRRIPLGELHVTLDLMIDPSATDEETNEAYDNQ
jgi:hypothetical protein